MIRLDRLVNVLGGYGVRLCGRPEARSARLRSVAMPDPTDAGVVGDVLLAVGAASVGEAVRWAVEARAAAVLVRAVPEAEREASLAGESEGVAVLLVDPAVSWSQLAGVVYGLVLEGRETESGRGPTDLFGLADSLADVIGGAVTIEDRLSRVLAYSRSQEAGDPARLETILARQVPERLREVFRERGVFARLAASDEPIFVEPDPRHGLAGRMAVAVRAGRELLGTVWVTCPEPLAGARRAALEDGARTVALHLLRSRASADLERQVESDLVIRLLEGSADAGTVVSRLGLPPGAMRVIAVRAHTAAERQARAPAGLRPGHHRFRLVEARQEHAPGQHALHDPAGRAGRAGARVGDRAGRGAAVRGADHGRHRRAGPHGGAAGREAGGRRVPGAVRGGPARGRAARVRRVLGRHPAAPPARGGARRTDARARAGERAAQARRRARHPLRRHAAGVAGGAGRSGRRGGAAARAPQHRP
ncbi:PucR family transcriptional regulator [Nonomuraea phyllanthi]|uniref:PucR family transcriptional regulator n=1 Tax=Nonomuraea phyllanthi TaxID=2219224 RepID=UPI003743A2F6